MLRKEYVAKANEVLKEIKSELGEGFHIPDVMGKPGFNHTLVTRIDFQESDEICITRDQISEEYNYREFLKDRIIAELKKKIVLLEDAVKKLEAYNVKPS